MARSINSKDIPRHATYLAARVQAKADREAAQIRRAAVQAMKDNWKSSRPGDSRAPITPAQQAELARIHAAQAGLIDPD